VVGNVSASVAGIVDQILGAVGVGGGSGGGNDASGQNTTIGSTIDSIVGAIGGPNSPLAGQNVTSFVPVLGAILQVRRRAGSQRWRAFGWKAAAAPSACRHCHTRTLTSLPLDAGHPLAPCRTPVLCLPCQDCWAGCWVGATAVAAVGLTLRRWDPFSVPSTPIQMPPLHCPASSDCWAD
jgi:hypothetical protein